MNEIPLASSREISVDGHVKTRLSKVPSWLFQSAYQSRLSPRGTHFQVYISRSLSPTLQSPSPTSAHFLSRVLSPIPTSNDTYCIAPLHSPIKPVEVWDIIQSLSQNAIFMLVRASFKPFPNFINLKISRDRKIKNNLSATI